MKPFHPMRNESSNLSLLLLPPTFTHHILSCEVLQMLLDGKHLGNLLT